MKRSTTIALAAASMGAGLFTGAASAQDMRAYDEVQYQRTSNEDAVRMRFTLPFGQAERDRRDPRLSLGFTRDFGGGQMRGLDVFSISFAGDAPRFETPLALHANEDGSAWYTSPTNWLIVGAGAAVAWAIYDHNQDDNSSPPPPPPPS